MSKLIKRTDKTNDTVPSVQGSGLKGWDLFAMYLAIGLFITAWFCATLMHSPYMQQCILNMFAWLCDYHNCSVLALTITLVSIVGWFVYIMVRCDTSEHD